MERPILFSAPMVRALLAGTKTVTRRLLKPRHDFHVEDGVPYFEAYVYGEPESPRVPCPYGAPGDRLWVKEAIALDSPWAEGERTPGHDCAIYAADNSPTTLDTWPWKRDRLPGMFMPHGLCRLKLDVTSIRVERLHDITEDDARREGVTAPNDNGHNWPDGQARRAFADLWASINGTESWAANPFVWVVSFQRVPQC